MGVDEKKPRKPASRKKISVAERAAAGGKTPRGPRREPKDSGQGPRLTNAQRVARDALIVQRRAQGWNMADIAEEAGIQVPAVSKIIARDADARDVRFLDQDPVETIEFTLREYHSSLVMYLMAAREARSTAEYVTAIRGKDATLERITKLYQAVGKLPRELGTLRHVIDFRGIGQEMVRALDALEAGEASVVEVRRFFELLTGIGKPGGPDPRQIVEGVVSEEAG